MMIFRRYSPNFLAAFWIVTMIAIWLAFAPTQAGGAASYIIVIGNSMEPKFHIGDLIIVHEEPTYQIGDAVTYRNLELNSFVFHRIVSLGLGRYSLRGDNNSWIDTYQPSQEEIIGKLWLYIPKGGMAIQKIRQPVVMAVMAGMLGSFMAVNIFTGKSKGKNHMKSKSVREWFVALRQKMQNWFAAEKRLETGKPSSFFQGGTLEVSFFALGLIALVSFILGFIAFSRPTTRIAHDEISYQHLGIFSYTASAPQGVYDSSAIKSGDPIFTRLTCSVDVNFQYNLIASQAENIAGVYQLTAIISEQVSGWQRSIPLQEQASFDGTSFGTSAKLDLCEAEGLIQSMEQGTDFHPGSYTLTIMPNINLKGEISSRELQDNFNEGLVFKYDRIHFYLINEGEKSNSLNLTETGILQWDHEQANTWLLFGVEIAIPVLRMVSLFGLVVSLIAIAMLGSRLQSLSRNDREAFVRMRYGAMLIDVQDAALLNGAGMVEVTAIEDLAKLAERFNTVILHERHGASHAYYVRGEGTAYRFVMTDGTRSAVPEGDAKILEGEL